MRENSLKHDGNEHEEDPPRQPPRSVLPSKAVGAEAALGAHCGQIVGSV
jgi:hypothetical protein